MKHLILSSQTLPTASSILHAALVPVIVPAPVQSSNCSSKLGSDSLVTDDAAADGSVVEPVAATDMTEMEMEVEGYVRQNAKEPSSKSVKEAMSMPCGVCSTMVSPLLQPLSIAFNIFMRNECSN